MASKGPNPLIDDPFAEPLVNAVGVDAFIRMMNGEVELSEDDPAFTPQRLSEGMAVRTRYFDNFFLDAAEAGGAPSRHSRVRAGHPRLPAADGRPGPCSTRSTSRRVIEFKTRTLADLGAAPTVDRRTSRSTCATTGWARCAATDSTRRSRRPGSLKDCSGTCRRTRRTACSTTSPR